MLFKTLFSQTTLTYLRPSKCLLRRLKKYTVGNLVHWVFFEHVGATMATMLALLDTMQTFSLCLTFLSADTVVSIYSIFLARQLPSI